MAFIPRPRDGRNEDDDGWADEDAPDRMKPKPKQPEDDNSEDEEGE